MSASGLSGPLVKSTISSQHLVKTFILKSGIPGPVAQSVVSQIQGSAV